MPMDKDKKTPQKPEQKPNVSSKGKGQPYETETFSSTFQSLIMLVLCRMSRVFGCS